MNITKNIKPEDYQFVGLWKNDLFSAYFWVEWFNKKTVSSLGLKVPFGGIVNLKGGNFFVHKDVLNSVGLQARKLLENGNYGVFSDFENEAKKEFKKLLGETDKLINAKPTGANFRKAKGIADKMMTFWCLGFLLAEAVDPLLFEKTSEAGIAPDKVHSLIPSVHSLILDQNKETKELYQELKTQKLISLLGGNNGKLAIEIEKNKALSRKFKNHLVKYGWIEMINYIGEPLTLNRLLEQIASSVTNPNEEKKVKEDIAIPTEVKKLLKALSSVSFVRQAGAEYSSIFHFKMLSFLKSTAKELGLSYRQMLNLSSEEVITGLKSKDRDYLTGIVQKRKEYNWLAFEDPKTKKILLTDDKKEIEKLYNKMVPKSDKKGDLTGQVGNKGKTKGVARVIMAIDDFSKFQDGDILVTTMTTPDFVILMQKSSAIVTDIGGLLCHAAIISREMNKPCVIGTKFATQTIKDGDMLEVDANAGVIKIIK